jgi:peptidoglycan DL-endopeptidase LytE
MVGRRTFLGVGLVFLVISLGLHPKGWAEERYTVKPGDTLFTISRTFGVKVESLKAANALTTDKLKLKQSLVIPTKRTVSRVQEVKNSPLKAALNEAGPKTRGSLAPQRTYVVQKGDTLQRVSTKTGRSIDEIKRLNQLGSGPLKIGHTLALEPSAAEGGEEDLADPEDAAEEEGPGIEQEKQAGAEPIGKWNTQEERSLLVRVVRTFLGAPYRLGGSTLKGLDCSAFVKRIYEVFNVYLPRTAREQSNVGKAVAKDDLQEGDLVFFKAQAPRTSNAHVGIYIGNNQFVHASSANREVKVDSLNTPYFSSHFTRGVRVKELTSDLNL